MLIGIITLASATIGALFGAGFKNTYLGSQMNESLEDAKDSILGTVREVSILYQC